MIRYKFRVEFTTIAADPKTRVVRFTRQAPHIGAALIRGRDEAYALAGPMERITDLQVSEQ